MTIELVIFDCDGVLVDSEPVANEELRLALEQNGLSLALDEVISHFVGLSMKNVVIKAEAMLEKALPSNFLELLQEKTFHAFRQDLQPVGGIDEVLESLVAKKQKICVASSGDFQKMDLTLGLTGLKKYFDGNIYSSSQVKRGKPYPDLYLFAAEQMDVDPAHCLVVEDSIPGVQGAVAAGMEVLAYSTRKADKKLAIAGGMVIHHMHDVLKYIGKAP